MKPYYEDAKAGIQIYHGNCQEIVPQLPQVDLVMADAPYGENQAEWDTAKPDTALWQILYNGLVDGGSLYYWGFWGHADWVLMNAKRVGLTPQSRIIWWFRTGRPEKRSYREDTEEAWFFSKNLPNAFNVEDDLEPYEDTRNYKRYGHKGKHPGTVWIASRIMHNHPENVGHETQKPLSLISKMIRISSNPGNMVLDPYMGSGTTLSAAKRLGRRAIGIELNEVYCEITARRLQQDILPFVEEVPVNLSEQYCAQPLPWEEPA